MKRTIDVTKEANMIMRKKKMFKEHKVRTIILTVIGGPVGLVAAYAAEKI